MTNNRGKKNPVASADVPENGGNALLFAILTALVLRIAYIWIFRTYHFPEKEKYLFGFETGAIARSIASGHGFSSPFHSLSGPSAWLAPLYPYFVASVFRICGIYSDRSAFVILSFNSVLSSLTCLPLYLLCRRLSGGNVPQARAHKIALAASWVWAVAPPAMFWAVTWVWETAASALLLTWLLWLTLTLAASVGIRRWLLFGVGWGIAALTNPSLLSFLPVSLSYPLWARRSRGQPWLSRALIVLLLFLNVITPWLLRNYEVFHYPVFIRPNLWAEVSFGNVPGADGTWLARIHPSGNAAEEASYNLMGEVQYVQWKKIQVVDFIRGNPGFFARLCARRVYLFWSGYLSHDERLRWVRATGWIMFAGLAAAGVFFLFRTKTRGAVPVTLLLLIYPLPYYVTFAFARYKHPIEPLMTALAVYAASQLIRLGRT